MAIVIDRIDHFVITAGDLEATARFYARVLGMTIARYGEGRTALHIGRQKINLHQHGAEAQPNAAAAAPGAADLCFIADGPFADVLAHLAAERIETVHGPIEQQGALGPMDSIYFRDPDGNLVEVAVYRG